MQLRFTSSDAFYRSAKCILALDTRRIPEDSNAWCCKIGQSLFSSSDPSFAASESCEGRPQKSPSSPYKAPACAARNITTNSTTDHACLWRNSCGIDFYTVWTLAGSTKDSQDVEQKADKSLSLLREQKLLRIVPFLFFFFFPSIPLAASRERTRRGSWQDNCRLV